MKAPGMLRKIDDLGRVVIPAELRKSMELETGDMLELTMEGDRLVLRKFTAGCIFCGGVQGLVTYGGKTLCLDCIEKLKRI